MSEESRSPTAAGDDASDAAKEQGGRGQYGKPGRQARLGQVLAFGRDRARGVSDEQAAKRRGVARSTLRAAVAAQPLRVRDETDAFWESPAGHAQLHRLVVVLHVVLTLCNPCGVEQVAQVLRHSGLGRYGATSYGVHQAFSRQLTATVGAFAQQQAAALGGAMPRRRITMAFDEIFFRAMPTLVALEPASNYLLVEQQARRCDEASWKAATEAALPTLNVEVVQGVGDEGKALGACIENALGAHRSTDLFHGQYEITRAASRALRTREKEAHEDAERADEGVRQAARRDRPFGPMPEGVVDRVEMLWRDAHAARARAQAATVRRQTLRQAVRALSTTYHPFDLATGAAREAGQVGRELDAAHAQAQTVGREAKLGFRVQEALKKSARLVPRMVATVGFFHRTVQAWVTEKVTDLGVQTLVLTVLVPFFYLQKVAACVACKDTRERVQTTVTLLRAQLLDPSGLWASLASEEKQRLQTLALEGAALFVRTSSAVEGRNGRLSLHHHALKTLRPDKLAALTAVHNFLIRRPDGTTAAERFFGRKPPDLLQHLVTALPMMGRPAARRRRPHRKELKMAA